jgi:hypothetical protein
MKNQKIKCYVGNYILPYGRPTVFITGWETDTEFFCERFILFETLKHEMICRGTCMHMNIGEYKTINGIKENNEALESFMNEFGKELAEADIFSIVVELMKDGQYGEINIKLFESKVLVNLYYIKKNFPDKLVWLRKTTACSDFQKLIDLVSGIDFTTTVYP